MYDLVGRIERLESENKRKDENLEQLYNRLESLERMHEELAIIAKSEVIRMMERVKQLDSALVDLQNAFKLELDHSTENLSNLYSLLWPLLDKIFPGAIESLDHIQQVLRRKPPSGKSTAVD